MTEGVIDLIEYNESNKKLRIIKNPYGFIKTKEGTVVYSKEKHLYYSDFVSYMTQLLKKKSDVFAIKDVAHFKVKH